MLHTKIKGTPSDTLYIFLHGFMGSSADWNKVYENLNEAYALFIDLPGHGNSPYIEASWSELAKLLNQTIQKIEPKAKKILVGYSFGARVALEMLSQQKELFHKVLLESANFGLENENERFKRKNQDSELFKNVKNKDDFKLFLENWYCAPIFQSIKTSPGFKNLIKNRLNGDQSTYQNVINNYGLAQQPNYWPKLKEIKSKIIYIYGEKDQKYSQMALRLKAEGIQTTQIKGASHNTHFQNPKIFTEILNNIT